MVLATDLFEFANRRGFSVVFWDVRDERKGRKMRKLVFWASMVSVGMFLFSGCGGITANARYSRLIDFTSSWARTVATKAENGEMTSEEMALGLRINADRWTDIQMALHGVSDSNDLVAGWDGGFGL